MKRSSGDRRWSYVGRESRGVILLVMLGMLALFTLIAVTFVVAAGQFRRGATAASKVEQMGDPFDVLLNQALMQVARGSNHPQSAIGPHGLLEDMYGNGDAVTGAAFIENQSQGNPVPSFIYTTGSTMTSRATRSHPYKGMGVPSTAPMLIEIGAVSFGWDREPGGALVDDDNNGIVDDITEVIDANGKALFGPGSDDCFLGSTRAHPAMVGIPPSANMLSDIPDQWQQAWNNKSTPVIDNVENYYSGRVITFIDGDAAGQSSYIVRSKILPLNPNNAQEVEFRTILWIEPFVNGAQPSHKDRFVINGRPFSGSGFGYNPYVAMSASALAPKPPFVPGPGPMGVPAMRLFPNPELRALDMPYTEPFIRTPADNGTPYNSDLIRQRGYPIALLPNPVDAGYRDYLNRYNAIIDADEDYDAPDEQNMLLSYSVWTPPLDPSGASRYRTIYPSLHRPDLIKYFTNQPGFAATTPSDLQYPRWLDVPPHLRRRYILRPDPSDHYDWTQEANAPTPATSDGWTPGEPFQDLNNNGQWDPVTILSGGPGPREPWIDLPTPKVKNNVYDIGDRAYYNTGFDAMDGPWDVDNDIDMMPDSIWVDLGAPVTTAPDGRFVKPLFAVLVRDLDGRVNVNAHGSHKHYDRTAAASGAYNPGAKPAPYLTAERVRMGVYAWAMYQSTPDVAFNTSDTMRVHTGGEAEAKRDAFTFGDIPYNGLWALPYRGDRPVNVYQKNPSNPNSGYRPLMFDLAGAQTGGIYERAKHVRGFEPAVGQGMSPATANIAQILHTSIWGLPYLPHANVAASNLYYTSSNYRILMEGKPTKDGSSYPVPGRYGESFLVAPYGVGGAFPGLIGPRAGITDQALNGYAATNPGPQPPYRGDDDWPPAPFRSRLPSLDSRFTRGNQFRESFIPLISTNPNLNGLPSINGMIVGDYGTPADHDEDGFVALDIQGQPVFHKMGTRFEETDAPVEINLHKRYFAQTYFGVQGSLKNAASVPYTSDMDAPFTPAEMERLLRAPDSASEVLPYRLLDGLRTDNDGGGSINYDLRRAVTTESWDIPCPHVAPTPELTYALSMLQLPVTNPTIGDLLRARFFLSHGQSINRDQAGRLATVALRSYRLQSIPNDVIKLTDQTTPPVTKEEVALFDPLYFINGGAMPYTGSARRMTYGARSRQATRLLSPDLGLGLRMDINAPFGNGYDDNVPQNGVVDEPLEWLTGETLWDTFPFDGNRDGNFEPSLDEEARQQFAKELYCLMMLLIDQNYVEPLPTSLASTTTAAAPVQGAETTALPVLKNPGLVFRYMDVPNTAVSLPFTAGDPNIIKMKTRRWLLARRMAQWAINVVDFRDRDSIMTPFEYDADPFYDNDLDTNILGPAALAAHFPSSNGTWDVNGYLPVNTLKPAVPSLLLDDTDQPWRGVVWGCEYPDLLLTETAAFHDRRTQNMMYHPPVTPDSNSTNLPIFGPVTTGTVGLTNAIGTTNELSDTSASSTDPDWDQRKVPQGTALFELYATGNPNNPALPRELYYNDGTNLYLDLGRVYTPFPNVPPTSANIINNFPVWRLAITESHYNAGTTSNATSVTNINDPHLSPSNRLREWPATCSLELSDPEMSLLPPSLFVYPTPTARYMPIERVVVFTTTHWVPPANAVQGLTNNLSSAPGASPIEVFYYNTRPPDPNLHLAAPPARVLPGDYVVVGPARQAIDNVEDVPSSPRRFIHGQDNITVIGQTRKRMVVASGGNATMQTYTQAQSIIDMGDPRVAQNTVSPLGKPNYPLRTFMITSVNGYDEYPIRTLNDPSRQYHPLDYATDTHILSGLVKTTTMRTIAPTTPQFINDYPAPASFQTARLQIRPPVSVPCGIRLGNRLVGLNISEPRTNGSQGQYYPAPDYPSNPLPDTSTDTSLITPDMRDDWYLKRKSPAPTAPNVPPFEYLYVQDRYRVVWDQPLDDKTGGSTGNPNPNLPPSQPTAARPVPRLDQTLLNYKTVFLQRLADPTRVWHEILNPYRTMDWMPIDLTIFNGEPHYVYQYPNKADDTGPWKTDLTQAAHAFDKTQPVRMPANPKPVPTIAPNVIRFGSRQRGGSRTPFRGNYSTFDLWSQPDWLETSPELDTRPPVTDRVSDSLVRTYPVNNATTNRDYYAVNQVRWSDPFDHTFGYLNLGFHVMRSNAFTATPQYASIAMQTFGTTGWVPTAASLPDGNRTPWLRMSPVREPLRRPMVTRSPAAPGAGNFAGWFTGEDVAADPLYDYFGNAPRYVGSPRRPFSWLTWNDRPFTGAMELMMVPATTQGRLLHDYSMRNTIPPTVPSSPQDFTETTAPSPVTPYVGRYAPFTGRRSANHYMPSMPVSAYGSVSSGHPSQYNDKIHNAAANPNTDIYTGQQESGFLVTPPFAHLLNFFESANAVGYIHPTDTTGNSTDFPTGNNTFAVPQQLPALVTGNSPTPVPNPYTVNLYAANYFRLFEFVTVPSRFSGTQHMHFANNGTLMHNRALLSSITTMPGNLGTQYEHYGWPFTAPYNKISMYREPGKVNINTIIPINTREYNGGEGLTNIQTLTGVIWNERDRDEGAGIWRSITNDFHPVMRWIGNVADILDGLGRPPVPGGGNNNQTSNHMGLQRQTTSSTRTGKYGIRAGLGWDNSASPPQFTVAMGKIQPADVSVQSYFFNPSEDYAANFYSAFASMFKDDPNSDPRGPDGVYQNWLFATKSGTVYSDDRMLHPFWNYASPPGWSRHDGVRPSMFSNPFRSFMEDYSAVPQSSSLNPSGPLLPRSMANKRYSSTGNPLLLIDSTILRRRDMTWNPWNPNWLPLNPSSSDQQGLFYYDQAQNKYFANLPVNNSNIPTNKIYSPAQIDPSFDPLFTLNYPAPSRFQGFDTQYMPGDATLKPQWWQFSGASSSLYQYINGVSATSTFQYAGGPIDNVRVKDADFRNTDRNPFFRYQLYTKLSNTITTRSNVYAIWVTVGYFECERVQPTQLYPVQTGHNRDNEFRNKHRYPDGFRILRELGSDNGEAVRHRAFAILDRTIPVGFLRGENLNVDRAFLIRRIID